MSQLPSASIIHVRTDFSHLDHAQAQSDVVGRLVVSHLSARLDLQCDLHMHCGLFDSRQEVAQGTRDVSEDTLLSAQSSFIVRIRTLALHQVATEARPALLDHFRTLVDVHVRDFEYYRPTNVPNVPNNSGEKPLTDRFDRLPCSVNKRIFSSDH